MSCVRDDEAGFLSYWLDHKDYWLLSPGILKSSFRQSWIRTWRVSCLYCLHISALHFSGLALFSGRPSAHGHTDDICSSWCPPCQLGDCSRKTLTSKGLLTSPRLADWQDLDHKPIVLLSLGQVVSPELCAHPWKHGECVGGVSGGQDWHQSNHLKGTDCVAWGGRAVSSTR